MIEKKFKFYENKEKFYTPETEEELKKLIKTPNIDFKQINTSKIIDMGRLFKGFIFNEKEMKKNGLQDISNWDVSNIENMSYMFANSNFNGDMSKWNVSNVKNMSWMFYDTPFNQDISNWNVSNVKNMQGMFIYSKFNQDISNWDISNVEDMSHMFYNSSFNQDISNWDVSNVKDMEKMFMYSDFNQDISNWDISNIEDMSYMFYESKFSYFDEILEKWPKIINLNCNIEEIFSDLKIQKEFENRIKKYQKLKNL